MMSEVYQEALYHEGGPGDASSPPSRGRGGGAGSTSIQPPEPLGEAYMSEQDKRRVAAGGPGVLVTKYKTSRFTGVSFNKRSQIKPWKAEIRVNSQKVYLGSFASEEEAAQAYARASKEKEKERIRSGRTHQYRVLANGDEEVEDHYENYPPNGAAMSTNMAVCSETAAMTECGYDNYGGAAHYGGRSNNGHDGQQKRGHGKRRNRQELQLPASTYMGDQMVAGGVMMDGYWGAVAQQEGSYDRRMEEVNMARDRYASAMAQDGDMVYEPGHPTAAAAAPSYPCASSMPRQSSGHAWNEDSYGRASPSENSGASSKTKKRRAYDMDVGSTSGSEADAIYYNNQSRRRVDDEEPSADNQTTGEGWEEAAATSTAYSPPSSPNSPLPAGEGAAAFTLSQLSLSTNSGLDDSNKDLPAPAAASAPPCNVSSATREMRDKMVTVLRKEFWTCLLDNNADIMSLLRRAIDDVEAGTMDELLESSCTGGQLDLENTTKKDALLAKLVGKVKQQQRSESMGAAINSHGNGKVVEA